MGFLFLAYVMCYISRMSSSLSDLKPKVQQLEADLVSACAQKGITFAVTQTLRTFAEQDALYAQGRTVPGTIVTNARGGYSFHNYGVAFDVCPTIGGKFQWNNIALFDQIGAIGQSLGLEWGGAWAKFPDKPHFQLIFDYSIEEFRQGKVDFGRYDLAVLPSMVVLPKTGLNVRATASTGGSIIGKLSQNQIVTPTAKQGDWYKIPFVHGSGWIAAAYVGPAKTAGPVGAIG